MDVKLDVMALPECFDDAGVPFISQGFQFGVLGLMTPEGELLHYFSIERPANAKLVVKRHQLAHRLKLQLSRITRTVAAQFPIIN
jgi:hypothetical protein